MSAQGRYLRQQIDRARPALTHLIEKLRETTHAAILVLAALDDWEDEVEAEESKPENHSQ